METQQRQIIEAIEACNRVLECGAAIYKANPAVAKDTWKSTARLRCTSTASKIRVNFSSIIETIGKFGTVTEAVEDHGTSTLSPLVFNFGELIPREMQNALHMWLPNRKFTLLYRASRDGFQSAVFHKHCDNKGPTLTIIRSRPHNYLFGGYASVPWESTNCYKHASEAFIFTITNPHNIPPTKYAILKPEFAIQCYATRGQYLVDTTSALRTYPTQIIAPAQTFLIVILIRLEKATLLSPEHYSLLPAKLKFILWFPIIDSYPCCNFMYFNKLFLHSKWFVASIDKCLLTTS